MRHLVLPRQRVGPLHWYVMIIVVSLILKTGKGMELFRRKKNLRAAVCKYRPGVGKIKISKNPKKNSVDYPRYLSNENINFTFIS